MLRIQAFACWPWKIASSAWSLGSLMAVATPSVWRPISAPDMPVRKSGMRISERHQSASVWAIRRRLSPKTRSERSMSAGRTPAATSTSSIGTTRSSLSRTRSSGAGSAKPIASRTTSRISTGMPVRSLSSRKVTELSAAMRS